MRLILCSILVLSGLVPVFHFSLAQFSGDIVGQSISITLQPQFPNPGDLVTATIDDYAYGGGGGEIIWSLDGVEVPDSTNKRSVTFTAGAVGVNQNISALLRFGNGQQMTASQTIVPYFLDVIIEPHTYTPFFYPGRGLPVHGSTVYLTALVHGANGLIPASEYSYNWQLNGTVQSGGSIRGGYKTKIVVPYGLSSIVTLSVLDRNGTTIARRLIEIPTADVDLHFYEVSTLYGLTEKSIPEKFTFIGNSTTIRAVPYNLGLDSVDTNLFTEWKIDGRVQNENSKDPFEVNLRRGTGDSSNVAFKLRHTVQLLQGDSEQFLVTF